MKKKKIYANKINKKIGNNQKFSEVCELKEETVTFINKSVEKKIDDLFNTNGYIFNVDVKIKTLDKTYNTKIASRVGNNIITLDNDIINIDDIKDIAY